MNMPKFRMSLREILVLVAMVALAISSLKYAEDTWLALVAGVTMIAFFVVLIVAVVDRGPRQAFAIGFALTMFAYGLILMTGQRTIGSGGSVSSKNIEFHQWEGRLPTTHVLRYIHLGVNSSGYFDNTTGKELPDYDPAKDPNREGGFGGRRVQTPGGGWFPAISYREIPPREKFMPIGHCWWAMILGYAGGHFARFVYWRRLRSERKLPAETS